MTDYDVCIVGSGAGGGIAAYVLAKKGARVLVLEKGPALAARDAGDDELRFGDRNLIDQDPLIEPRTFRDSPEQGDHLFVGKVLPVSRCVGGGTVHYGAVCFRFRPEDFRALTTWGQLTGADIVDWPLTYPEVAPFYRSVESLIGVAGGQMANQEQPGNPVPGAEWRRDPYPMPGHPANYGARLFEEAASNMGLHPFPTPVAINNGEYKGRAGCTYCGFCSSHKCPIGAKGDLAVTALAKAVATGRCDVKADSYVFKMDYRGGKIRRVAYFDKQGRARSARAKVFVLAASTVETPRLVLLSELPRNIVNHDVVGRYLMVHHFPGGIGFFEQRIDYYKGFWSMRCLDDLYLGDPDAGATFGFGNVQTVGPSSGYPFMGGGIISTAKTANWGVQHKEFMRRVFGHVQFVSMIGDDPPVRTNMVDLDPTVKDVWGLPVSRVTFRHHPNDYVVAGRAVSLIEELLVNMGAIETQAVLPFGSTTAIPQGNKTGEHERGIGRSFPDTLGGLFNHQMGTMRMGTQPDESVVDRWGRFWGVPNLYVMDGSVFPTSGGYNPTLTIQALAWRAAEHLAHIFK